MMENEISYKKTVLTIAIVTSFLTPFMGAATNIALPAIGAEFRTDAVLLSWVSTAYLLTSAIFLIPFGRLSDIYGRRSIFVSGLFVFFASSTLLAFAGGIWHLIVLRSLQGVGSSMIFGTSLAILTSAYGQSERGKAMGITIASTYTGLSAGPFLGGIMVSNLGWRSVFAATALPCALALMLAVKKLKKDRPEARCEKFDALGSLIYSLMLTLAMMGFSRLPDIHGVYMLSAGAALLFVFAAFEASIEYPVFNFRLFTSSRVFAFSNIAALIHYSSTFGLTFLLSLYFQYVKGLTAQKAGLVLVAQPAVMALLSPLAGKLSDRFEPRFLSSFGMAMTAAGLFALSFVNENTSLTSIALILVLIGAGFAFFSSPNANAVMGAVNSRFYGAASGTLSTMRMTGQMLSMGISTLALSLYVGKAQITPDAFPRFTAGMHAALTVFSVLCVAATFMSLARGSVKR